MKIKIYKITNKINNKVYIGQTSRPLKKRLWDHITKANRGLKRKFHLAISELGKENFEIEEIAETDSKEVANEIELNMMKMFDSIENGYNTYLQTAGSNNRGSSNGMAGKFGAKNTTSRSIIAVYYDDSITEWESMSLFCEANPECDVRNVQAVAAGRRSTANNFTFFYKKDFSEEKVKEKREKAAFQKRVTLLDENGNLIKHFKDLDSAAEETKISKCTIRYRIKKNNKNEDKSYFVYDLKIFK